MRLSCKMLKNVENVNNWQFTGQASIQEGQSNEIYLQLVDLDKVPGADKSVVLPENPLRYIPQGAVVTLTATFPSIDSAVEFSVIGFQPFSDDKSVWKFSFLSTQLPKTGSFKLTLVEDSNSKHILAKNAISTELLEIGSC